MRFPFASLGACFLVAAWLSSGPLAQQALAQKAKAPARCNAVNGVLLTPASKGWSSVAEKSDVPADQLLIALFGAEFSSPGGSVHVRAVADVGQRGPFPVLEAALRFHPTKTADLELSLERGIVVLSNTKKSGPANVRLRLRAETFSIELHEPKARLAVEVYGRHLPGPPKLDDPKTDDPVANIAFFALEGDSAITTEKHTSRLHAPPGPALYLWDNVSRSAEVIRYESLPDFAKPMSEEERKKFEALGALAKKWADEKEDDEKAFERALISAATSQEAMERKAAVVALGAVDSLPGLMKVLNNKNHADARDVAILVVRHWLGREAGQSVRLYEYLTKNENYTPVQAKNLLHLFNGIDKEKRRQPNTYEVLIHGLNHSKMPARELARWHLIRLVPDGKSIAYDAAGSAEQRLEAIAAWRRLIPEGELPPLPKKKSTPN